MFKDFSEHFDAIIVGSGPAGGECARELAKRGRKILLMEKSTGIGRPNFSSGGTPLETFKEFDLPLRLGRGSWSKILISAYDDTKTWNYGGTRGYVFAFDKLKQFLVGEAVERDAEILISTAAEEPIIENGFVTGIKCRGVFGEGIVRGKVIVDASGPVGVLASKVGLRPAEPCAASIGIELIVQGVPEEFKNVLAFYFSHQYVPYGYGWIFPFGENQLKVGIAVYKAKERGISEANHGTADMMELLKKFMRQFPQLDIAEPMDLHGGNIYINGGLKKHSQDGFLVIGDAAMQINPLAGEGIRHALHSGRMAAEVIDEALSKNDLSKKSLSKYDERWSKYVGRKWKQSFMISEKLYNKLSRSQWKDIMHILSALTPEEVIEVGFNFNFSRIVKFSEVLEIASLIEDVIK